MELIGEQSFRRPWLERRSEAISDRARVDGHALDLRTSLGRTVTDLSSVLHEEAISDPYAVRRDPIMRQGHGRRLPLLKCA